ncbi:MAG TPA: twin-arginine translocase subunit TatC, partial [Fimbriimonadaceae bacterium]|nr:twin-arginine translocase subunit TatC [Fimbriimonadaceae bacterium]
MAALFKSTNPRNSSEDPEEFRATLVEHLEELRTRIVRSLWLIIAGWVVAWNWIQPWASAVIDGMVDKNVRPMLDAHHIPYQIAWHSATEPFMFKLKFTFLMAIALAFPFLILQAWGFVAPALKPNEKKPFKVLAPFSVLLFFIGA